MVCSSATGVCSMTDLRRIVKVLEEMREAGK